ncbi:MAG: hypothetical protein PV344_04865 [Anaplasma sp.]|nr:hypothetical protein [Anaplasma sp.]
MRGLVIIMSGSQPKGRGFESRLKFFKFLFEANELLYKVKSFETCGDLFRITCHLLITFIPRLTSRFTRALWVVSNSRARSCGCDVMIIDQSRILPSRHANTRREKGQVLELTVQH